MIKYETTVIEKLNNNKDKVYVLELTINELHEDMHPVLFHCGDVVFKIDKENHIEILIADASYEKWHLFELGRKIQFEFDSLSRVRRIQSHIKGAFRTYTVALRNNSLTNREFYFMDDISIIRLIENDIPETLPDWDDICIIDRQNGEEFYGLNSRIKKESYMTTEKTKEELCNTGTQSELLFPLSFKYDLTKPRVIDNTIVVIESKKGITRYTVDVIDKTDLN